MDFKSDADILTHVDHVCAGSLNQAARMEDFLILIPEGNTRMHFTSRVIHFVREGILEALKTNPITYRFTGNTEGKTQKMSKEIVDIINNRFIG